MVVLGGEDDALVVLLRREGDGRLVQALEAPAPPATQKIMKQRDQYLYIDGDLWEVPWVERVWVPVPSGVGARVVAVHVARVVDALDEEQTLRDRTHTLVKNKNSHLT